MASKSITNARLWKIVQRMGGVRAPMWGRANGDLILHGKMWRITKPALYQPLQKAIARAYILEAMLKWLEKDAVTNKTDYPELSCAGPAYWIVVFGDSETDAQRYFTEGPDPLTAVALAVEAVLDKEDDSFLDSGLTGGR